MPDYTDAEKRELVEHLKARARPVKAPLFKTCTRCNVEQPQAAFYRHSNSPDLLYAECIRCCKDYHREWYVRKKKSELAVLGESYTPLRIGPPRTTKDTVRYMEE